MKRSLSKVIFLLLSSVLMMSGCNLSKNGASKSSDKQKSGKIYEPYEVTMIDPSGETPWSVRMGETILKLHPDIWTIRDPAEPKWQYDVALVLGALIELGDASGESKYYDYAKKYPDTFIDEEGQIGFNYKLRDYNIDHINSGKMLFRFYEDTKDPRYKIALDTLRKQLQYHPRTQEGSFWHKLRYTHQVWLDGLYMGQPFYAEYALRFNEPEVFDDVIRQLLYIEEKARDAGTGLLYHGWDEAMEQSWANKETGLSKNFWSRGVGWYAMALVDALDFIPADHPGRKDVMAVLGRLGEAILKVQDKETGLWYQVLDQGDREGNYLESTGSAMFAYSFLKAARLGYVDQKYGKMAARGYNGIINNLIRVEEDGSVIITHACGGAGLSDDRDGTYEYYVNETIRENDPKAIGPFILASLEYEKLLSAQEPGPKDSPREQEEHMDLKELRKLCEPGKWTVTPDNPVIKPGAAGEWDSWNVATANVLKVGDTYHMYYEAGSEGVIDYQIGHAISTDGIHWSKDPANPVVALGDSGEWDDRETWDPFVIYEDGIFKMWYGGTTMLDGKRDFQIGYASSKDGTNFSRYGKISNYPRGNVGDMHIVHHEPSGKYYMYYLDRNLKNGPLLRAESSNETDFDFEKAALITIPGEEDGYRCPHVFLDGGKWYMYYGYKRKDRAGYAVSADGLNWEAKNTAVFEGDDAEILKISRNLYLMYYLLPEYQLGHLPGCDIRVAVYKGSLDEL